MKVIVYQNTYSEKHSAIAEDFATGVPGAILKPIEEYEPSDVAVVFGLVKKSYAPTYPKQRIIDAHTSKSLIVIESGFVKRPDYYAIGWGGIHGDADFCTDDVTGIYRWLDVGVKLHPWKYSRPGPRRVLVCGQVPWDTNVQDFDYILWCQKIVRKLRAHGHTVRFRPHPRMFERWEDYGIKERLIDPCRKLHDALDWAQCVVVWNSTSGIDAVIRGVPVIAFSRNAMVRPLSSSTQLEMKHLSYPDRKNFFAKLAYSQWTREEMRSGLPWKHLLRRVYTEKT